MSRTYFYKLTSDRGGAPCAIEPEPGGVPLLTLAICKPAIRRTAEAGDRVVGITSHALARSDGYPLLAVIYAARVAEALDARDYFDPETQFSSRPDCIYRFHEQNGRAHHAGGSPLHRTDAHLLKDLGSYPFYRNGRILLCRDFRYFGASAVAIPPRLNLLLQAAETLGQGHRVYEKSAPEASELDALFRYLWKRATRYTPAAVGPEAYDRSGNHRMKKPKTPPTVLSCSPRSPGR